MILINTLLEYKCIDEIVTQSALNAFASHLWYITEELVPLALFCSNIDSEKKQKMVDKMLALEGNKI